MCLNLQKNPTNQPTKQKNAKKSLKVMSSRNLCSHQQCSGVVAALLVTLGVIGLLLKTVKSESCGAFCFASKYKREVRKTRKEVLKAFQTAPWLLMCPFLLCSLHKLIKKKEVMVVRGRRGDGFWVHSSFTCRMRWPLPHPSLPHLFSFSDLDTETNFTLGETESFINH